MKRRIDYVLGLALIAIGLGASPMTCAQGSVPFRDQQVAAIIFRLPSYIGWPKPKSKTPSFRIGILGADPFGGILHGLFEDRKIDGRPVEVLVIEEAGEVTREDLESFHMLYVPEAFEPEWRTLARDVDIVGLLVIGEGEEGVFTDKAVFNVVAGATDLEIQQRQARRARLTITARLSPILSNR